MSGRRLARFGDVNVMCDDLFRGLAEILKSKLTPAFQELFKAHPSSCYNAIDVDILAQVIFPDRNSKPADFTFQYEKDVVKKVNKNQKKISEANDSIQSLTNKLNIAQKRISSSKREISSLKSKLAALKVDSEMQIAKIDDKVETCSTTLSNVECSVINRIQSVQPTNPGY